MKHRSFPFALTLVLALVLAAGCGSSSKDSASDVTSTTTADCPFDGTTDPQTQPGAATATELTSGSSDRSGCIDQLTLAFTPTLAATSAKYTADEPVLEVTLAETSYTGETELPTTSMEYVESISVATTGTDTIVTLTLDKQRPFLLSSSEVPAELQLSIG